MSGCLALSLTPPPPSLSHSHTHTHTHTHARTHTEACTHVRTHAHTHTHFHILSLKGLNEFFIYGYAMQGPPIKAFCPDWEWISSGGGKSYRVAFPVEKGNCVRLAPSQIWCMAHLLSVPAVIAREWPNPLSVAPFNIRAWSFPLSVATFSTRT